MSDAAQIVEDVVECRVGLLTCLGNENYDSWTVKQLCLFILSEFNNAYIY